MDIGDLRPAELGQFIDHTLLKPDATEKDIGRLTEEAVRYGFAAVCVNPTWVSFCVDQLGGTEVAVATVVGFPLGATVTSAKVLETEIAVTEGAVEIDMVINIGRLSSGQLDVVKSDIAAVVTAADLGKAITKVIIETALLSDEQKIIASKLAVSAGADFVKTSTGFAGGGAQVKDVELIRLNIPSETGIKASGGIRTVAEVRSMLSAGATRIGASAGVTIVSEEAEG